MVAFPGYRLAVVFSIALLPRFVKIESHFKDIMDAMTDFIEPGVKADLKVNRHFKHCLSTNRALHKRLS